MHWWPSFRGRRYDLVYNSLDAAARRALEAMMKGYEYQSDFARKYYSLGFAESVLTVLRMRGIAVPDSARERLLGERDRAQLDRWLERAVVAASIADVLGEPS
jgi:hypothetical protein